MVLQKCQGTTCNRGEFGLWPCKKSPECILSSIFFPEDAPSTSRPRNKRFGQELSLFANHLGRQNGDTLEEFHGSPGWRMVVKKKFLTDLGGSFSWLGWLFLYIYNYIYIYCIYIYHSMFLHINQKHIMFHPFRDTLELWVFVPKPRVTVKHRSMGVFGQELLETLRKLPRLHSLDLAENGFQGAAFLVRKTLRGNQSWCNLEILMDFATLCIVWVGNWYPSWN